MLIGKPICTSVLHSDEIHFIFPYSVQEKTINETKKNQIKLEMCPQYTDAPDVGYLTIKLQNSDLLYILTPSPAQGHDPGAMVPYIQRS